MDVDVKTVSFSFPQQLTHSIVDEERHSVLGVVKLSGPLQHLRQKRTGLLNEYGQYHHRPRPFVLGEFLTPLPTHQTTVLLIPSTRDVVAKVVQKLLHVEEVAYECGNVCKGGKLYCIIFRCTL